MDVICAGMYRSCSTWQYDVVARLLERHRGGRRLGFLTGGQYADLARDDPAGDGWRALKSHDAHPRLALALAEGRALAVYAHRDLRDVTCSMVQKSGIPFADFVAHGMVHNILDNDRFWTGRPGVLVQRYEAIVAEPEAAVAGLADFLGIDLARGEAAELAGEYSLDANRRRTEALRRTLQDEGVDLSRRANLHRFDAHTLLHWNHLRDGRVGGWRAETGPSERFVLGRLATRWLIRRGYEADRHWARPGGGPAAGMSGREWANWELRMALGWVRQVGRRAATRYPRHAPTIKRMLGMPMPPPSLRAPHLAASRGHGAPATSQPGEGP